jgi:hypothetical protein
MENYRGLIFALVLVAGTPAALCMEKSNAPKILDGPGIIAAFEGKSVRGVYADGRPVRETYAVGGAIDYWEAALTSKGQWSVVNNLLCTFYDNTAMAGGCFQVEQLSANCFDYIVRAGSTEDALAPKDGPRFVARGHIEGVADTCPDDVSV